MHRNSQKRIYGDYIYFITSVMQDKIDLFKEEIFCEFWIEELKMAKEIKKFEIYALCLNYDHFHLLIKPDNNIANYSQIMHFFKRHTSRNINIILGYNKIDLNKLSEHDNDNCHQNKYDIIPEGDVGQRRLREFDKTTYQYHQKYIAKFGINFHHPKFKWQKSFHDHIIRNNKDFENHWKYTMHNYLKHSLPENWKYSGLNYPDLIDDINNAEIE